MSSRTVSHASGASEDDAGLGWLLDDLTDRVQQVMHALVLSNDGLVTGASRDLSQADAEHLAAVSSGFHSLAKGAGQYFSVGGARQTMIEFDEGFLFVTTAGDGSCLAVLTGTGADVGQVAYEMTLLVHRVGEHLGVPAREGDRTVVLPEVRESEQLHRP
ncbi:roadblock/LC7 domain-containing protein [Streptomyces sp. RB6PN25]|uniref:Roadblock/LC7 domain-containing protein n=1 Tax=Streptomyces humicola TaxID=2953240 RepID=A0ABT1Q055_9ACTN|nr:roadblock/LC7 domain-containing protein [Streptomyces humicola]MCQ4083308.1 roadblock/LC7 domain-containing protein [Streptomyces humicola]